MRTDHQALPRPSAAPVKMVKTSGKILAIKLELLILGFTLIRKQTRKPGIGRLNP